MRAATAVVAAAAALFITISVVLALTSVRSGELTRDPAALASLPFYTGAVATLGIWLWAITAAITGFTSEVLRRTSANHESAAMFRFAAVLSTLLLLDDQLQVHEEVFPVVLGLPESLVYAGHAGLFAVFVIRFLRTLLSHDALLLAGAAMGFTLALCVDLLPPRIQRLWSIDHYLAESFCTTLGIGFWCAFFTRAAFSATCRTDPTTRIPEAS